MVDNSLIIYRALNTILSDSKTLSSGDVNFGTEIVRAIERGIVENWIVSAVLEVGGLVL